MSDEESGGLETKGTLRLVCPAHGGELRFSHDREWAWLTARGGSVACYVCGREVSLTQADRDGLERFAHAWQPGHAPTVAGDLILTAPVGRGRWRLSIAAHQGQQGHGRGYRWSRRERENAMILAARLAQRLSGRIYEIGDTAWREIFTP